MLHQRGFQRRQTILRNGELTRLAAGAAKASRDPSTVDLIVPVFAIPGDTPEERAEMIRRTKTQLAFYGSTPNYAFQFEDLGYSGVTPMLGGLMKKGDVAGMMDVITDEMLEHFAVVAPWQDLADKLLLRYQGSAARVVMYLAAEDIRKNPGNLERWGEIARAVTSNAV